MNSTDKTLPGDTVTAALAALFDEVLLPIAQEKRVNGRTPFPLAPDVRWLSYYVKRRRSAMGPGDFTGAACADAAEFGRQLGLHWQALGRTELAAQAERFGQAAQVALNARPAGAAAEGDGSVNPYVYVMF